MPRQDPTCLVVARFPVVRLVALPEILPLPPPQLRHPVLPGPLVLTVVVAMLLPIATKLSLTCAPLVNLLLW